MKLAVTECSEWYTFPVLIGVTLQNNNVYNKVNINKTLTAGYNMIHCNVFVPWLTARLLMLMLANFKLSPIDCAGNGLWYISANRYFFFFWLSMLILLVDAMVPQIIVKWSLDFSVNKAPYATFVKPSYVVFNYCYIFDLEMNSVLIVTSIIGHWEDCYKSCISAIRICLLTSYI